MRRTLVVLSLLLVCAPAAAAWGALQDGSSSDRPVLRAALAACSTGATEAERFAVFTGSMPAYRGTKRMAMRFELFIRAPGTQLWEAVRSKGFGRWERSDPGRAGFVYTKRVERLLPGAEYRVAVRFRWYQVAGSGPRRPDRARRSPVCEQPDQRPNLRQAGVEILPGPSATTATYRVTLENAGEGAARAFDVALVSSAPDDVRSIAGLPAGERATVDLVGGRCSDGVPVHLLIDVDRVVDKSDERDNRPDSPCAPR